jgi:hypothetical protein
LRSGHAAQKSWHLDPGDLEFAVILYIGGALLFGLHCEAKQFYLNKFLILICFGYFDFLLHFDLSPV